MSFPHEARDVAAGALDEDGRLRLREGMKKVPWVRDSRFIELVVMYKRRRPRLGFEEALDETRPSSS